MMYIDVLDVAGNKLGGGPITSATGWQSTRRMDRAGSFSFTCPMSDPKASVIAEKRRVVCYALLNNVWTEIGNGIVDQIETTPGIDDTVMLTVSGQDSVYELAGFSAGYASIASGSNAIAAQGGLDILKNIAANTYGAAWTFDYASVANNPEVYALLQGESLLAGVGNVAKVAGYHFRSGGLRALSFFQGSTPSGVRAIRASGNLQPETCAITSLRRTVETHDLFTRVVPFGAGQGRARLTLAPSNRETPVGYTANKTAVPGFIERDEAVAQYGRIDRWVEFKEIGPIANTDLDVRAAANALFDYAKIHLDLYSRRATHYALEVAQCSRALLPGQSIRVDYRDAPSGLVINEDLFILEATIRVDSNGVRTTSLVVSDQDRWPVNDAELLGSALTEAKVYRSHPQLNANSYTTSYIKNIDSDVTATIRFWFGNEVVQLQQVLLQFQLLQFESTVKAVALQSMTGGSGQLITDAGGGGSTTVPSNDTSGTPSVPDTGAASGSTGAASGNTSGPSSDATGAAAGNTGQNNSNTSQNNSNTSEATGNTSGPSVLDTGSALGNTGENNGNTSTNNGNTSQNNGNTSTNNGNTGSVTGNTGTPINPSTGVPISNTGTPTNDASGTPIDPSTGVPISNTGASSATNTAAADPATTGGSSAGASGGPLNPATGTPLDQSGGPNNNLSGPSGDTTGSGGTTVTDAPTGGDTIAAGQHAHDAHVFQPSGGEILHPVYFQLFPGSPGFGSFVINNPTGYTVQGGVSASGNHTHGIGLHSHNLNNHTHDLNGHVHTLGNHTHSVAHTHGLAHTHSIAHTHGIAHSHSLSGHAHSLSDHSHNLGNHAHNLGNHSHTLGNHSHTLGNHSHTLGNHSHGLNHSHTLDGHTHTLNHSHTLNNHSHTLNNHSHTLSHSHTLGNHTHDMGNHTHTLGSHVHTLGAHTHSLNGHTHSLNNHQHTMTPTINMVYGVFRESLANTYGLSDLEFRVNNGTFAALASAALDVGGGWYRLDITSMVQDATSGRPLQETNTIQIRRMSSASDTKTTTVDALLSVRNVIQSISFI